MKISVAISLFLSLTASSDGSHLPYLRQSGGDTTLLSSNDPLVLPESSCNAVHDSDHCIRTTDTKSGHVCIWCVAGAIPSECMSPEQAALLPAGVFDCAATPGSVTSPATATTFTFESSVFATTQTYSLVQRSGPHHDVVVEPPAPSKSDLCDASSNSLSGYMDIQGSEFDQSGENKHLFYWFFEKRGADLAADTPVRLIFEFHTPHQHISWI
jgi:hypothetical protein